MLHNKRKDKNAETAEN